ncbi:MAG: 4,4'-diaponeurosporenoate glycosyltransferase [Myxococcota bacterium]|nr:4,4'-diaponeurosporenoate glycosyltransferase [Myxococcota bacterium]
MMLKDIFTDGLVAAGALIWCWRLRVLFQRVDSPPAPSPRPRVSIIIPARNEAHNLPALLRSLRALEEKPHEIIVVDDNSSDGTGDVAKSHGASVLPAPPLPAGWNGKPWACTVGAREATGDLLLFMDADTSLSPDAMTRAVDVFTANRMGLLSLTPWHLTTSAWELFQGVYHALFLVAAPVRMDRGHSHRFAIGQFMLIRRDLHDRIGGHEAIRGVITEDAALAANVMAAGETVGAIAGQPWLRVRMYPEGFRAFLHGWRRSFAAGLGAGGMRTSMEVFLAITFLLGVPWKFLEAAAEGWIVRGAVLGAALLVLWMDLALRQRRLGQFPVWTAPLYPIFLAVFIFVSLRALVDRLTRRSIEWKGRLIDVE